MKSLVLNEVREGRVATCVKLNLADPRVVEICALAGAHCVWLDNEHVPNDWLNLEHMIRAARARGIDAMVRVSKGSYSNYLKPFEAGASGVMVPHVANADEARTIVEMTRFRPLGRRPLDGGNVDGSFCQIPLADYLEQSNCEQFVVLQIESPEALNRVEEIAAVPGFDFLLFGVGDFAYQLGYPGQLQHPEVVAARRRVERAAVEHRKHCVAVGYHAPIGELIERGYGMINVQSDVTSLADGLTKAVRAQSAVVGTADGRPASVYSRA